MAEIGYAVDPAFRGIGYGRAILESLLAWAEKEQSIRTIRASVSPGNLASRALVEHRGFLVVGEQWDDEDGRELVYHRTIKPWSDDMAHS